jgi:hypothetical protein
LTTGRSCTCWSTASSASGSHKEKERGRPADFCGDHKNAFYNEKYRAEGYFPKRYQDQKRKARERARQLLRDGVPEGRVKKLTRLSEREIARLVK